MKDAMIWVRVRQETKDQLKEIAENSFPPSNLSVLINAILEDWLSKQK